MPEPTPNRRSFLRRLGQATAGASLALATQKGLAQSPSTEKRKSMPSSQPLLATNVYPWFTFYRREGRDLEAELETFVKEVKQSGADSLEPILNTPEKTHRLADVLTEHGIAMVSAYVNSALHEPEEVETSIDTVLELARIAQARMGTEIIVTNPNPIRWGGPENKSDEQIKFQAESLNRLGEALSREGLVLAYHNHDPELRLAAREFHHMLVATDPHHVKFCLDSHWIYRGAGDSQVALFDVIKLYGDRIAELHVRQSRNGVWTETLGEGDIDYPLLVDTLVKMGIHPLVTVEQAVEEGSPNTQDSLAAHTASHRRARDVFAPFL